MTERKEQLCERRAPTGTPKNRPMQGGFLVSVGFESLGEGVETETNSAKNVAIYFHLCYYYNVIQ